MQANKLLGSLLVSVGALAGCARDTAPTLKHSDTTPVAMRQALESGIEAGAGGGAASLGDPTGWGTLKGKFTLLGSAPRRAALAVNKDVAVCAPGGRQVLEETMVIGPGGGVKDVVIFVSSKLPTDDPRWEHPDYEATKNAEGIFDQKDCVFLTHVGAFRASQQIKVINSDSVGHNTNIDSKRGAAGRNFLVSANSFTYYEPGAPSPAPFPVSCNIHPWMKAWMMICDHPYFAVTAEDGSFEIKNLPAGVELEFRVWQEAIGNVQQVTVNDQSERWSKGKFTVALSPEETREMNVVVDYEG